MFRPNQNCIVKKSSGNTDIYGMPLPGPMLRERLAVVELNVVAAKSSVRADTSASRGNAQELETVARFLVPKSSSVEIDDMIVFGGMELRAVAKFPRHDLQGRLDHYEITCTYWRAT